MKHPRFLLLLLVVTGMFIAGRTARKSLGLELSPQSVLDWIRTLGWYAPVIFVGVVGFRTFLFLPSAVVLSAGGLLFGTLWGTLFGWFGVILSGAVLFAIGRYFGTDAVPDGLRKSLRRFDTHINRLGPLTLGAVTAHPLGPMAAVHCAAGLSTLRFLAFLGPVVLAGSLRAFGYSFFGMSLVEIGSTQFYLATTVLLALIVVPLAVPALRQRILGGR
jgi:uncharacterized membrane protein YdjX (TVP38/TMEM64 family)